MRKEFNWPLAGFFLVAAAFPVTALIYGVAETCRSESLMAEMAKDKPFLGCSEFWLNRYQTVISAFVAAAAAAATIYMLTRQTLIAQKQSIPAVISVLSGQISKIEIDLKKIRVIEEIAERIPTTVEYIVNIDNNESEIRSMISSLNDGMMDAFVNIGESSRYVMIDFRAIDFHKLYNERSKASQVLFSIMSGSFDEARRAVKQGQHVPKSAVDEFNKLRAAMVEMRVALGAVDFPLRHRRQQIEDEIHRLERELLE